MKDNKTCNHCNVLLTEENFYASNLKKCNYICNACDTIKNRKNKLKRLAASIGQAVYNKYDKVKRGHIYVVSNPAWKGWYKVGMAVDAEDRCRTYQTSSPLRDFKLEYSEFFADRKETEKLVHDKLTATGCDNRGEWFKLSLNKIKTIIKDMPNES